MSFKEAVKNVKSKGGYDDDEASAIVAKASRDASPAAKKANPKLAKVKGKQAPKGKPGTKKPASKGKQDPKNKQGAKKPLPKSKQKKPSFKGETQGFGNPFA